MCTDMCKLCGLGCIQKRAGTTGTVPSCALGTHPLPAWGELSPDSAQVLTSRIELKLKQPWQALEPMIKMGAHKTLDSCMWGLTFDSDPVEWRYHVTEFCANRPQFERYYLRTHRGHSPLIIESIPNCGQPWICCSEKLEDQALKENETIVWVCAPTTRELE